MSKSLSNAIGLTEPPHEMLGKIMSISDEMMYRYYELLTDLSLTEISQLRQKAATGAANPMEFKIELARRIIADFHSPQRTQEAEEEFRRVFQNREQPPVTIATVLTIHSNDRSWVKGRNLIRLERLLYEEKLASSVSEAARKIKEGAVYVNGNRWQEPLMPLEKGQPNELLLKIGRHYRKVFINIV